MHQSLWRSFTIFTPFECDCVTKKQIEMPKMCLQSKITMFPPQNLHCGYETDAIIMALLIMLLQ